LEAKQLEYYAHTQDVVGDLSTSNMDRQMLEDLVHQLK
jgi:hypothetical protein